MRQHDRPSGLSRYSPADVAAALDAAIPGASSSGSVLTLPPAPDIEARVVGYAALTRELRRQEQHFRVTLWCPTPALRDAAGAAVDGTLAAMDFLALPGPSSGRITYSGSLEDDVPSKANLWRRKLRYCVEYAPTQSVTPEDLSAS